MTLADARRDVRAAGDQVVVARVADGDRGALEELYGRFAARCFGLARRIVIDDALAQDVVQETFLAAWRQCRYDPARGAVSSWLLTITHHKAVDTVRREQRRRGPQVCLDQVHDLLEAGPGPAESAATTLQRDQVRAALSTLPIEQREVVVLAYYGGYTQAEIAAMRAIPLGTVKTRTLAAMRKLARALPEPDTAAEADGHANPERTRRRSP